MLLVVGNVSGHTEHKVSVARSKELSLAVLSVTWSLGFIVRVDSIPRQHPRKRGSRGRCPTPVLILPAYPALTLSEFHITLSTRSGELTLFLLTTALKHQRQPVTPVTIPRLVKATV